MIYLCVERIVLEEQVHKMVEDGKKNKNNSGGGGGGDAEAEKDTPVHQENVRLQAKAASQVNFEQFVSLYSLLSPKVRRSESRRTRQ